MRRKNKAVFNRILSSYSCSISLHYLLCAILSNEVKYVPLIDEFNHKNACTKEHKILNGKELVCNDVETNRNAYIDQPLSNIDAVYLKLQTYKDVYHNNKSFLWRVMKCFAFIVAIYILVVYSFTLYDMRELVRLLSHHI